MHRCGTALTYAPGSARIFGLPSVYLRVASAIASSNGAKTYTVAWNENGSTYSSNDNATYWQGYAGYPVIAVLMLQGRLPLDRAAADGFAQVDWTDLNERCKERLGEITIGGIVQHIFGAAPGSGHAGG